MLFSMHKWSKIVNELYKLTNSRTPRNTKMFNDKWNWLNSDFKKLFNYHKGIGRNISYWQLLIEECDKHYLQHHFNCYNAIEAFQGERIINALLHMKDVHVDRNGVLLRHMKNPKKKDETQSQPHCFFMEDLCDDYVFGKKSRGVQQCD
jgi:hypothetical protein